MLQIFTIESQVCVCPLINFFTPQPKKCVIQLKQEMTTKGKQEEMTQTKSHWQYIIKVHPYFLELQPRLEVYIIQQFDDDHIPTQKLIVHRVVAMPMENHTVASVIKAFLHSNGYRRTGKFTRVDRTSGNAIAKIEVMPPMSSANKFADSDVERMGVL